MESILIGTLMRVAPVNREPLQTLIQLGFESLCFTYWQRFNEVTPELLAEKVMPELREKGVKASAISLFANPMAETEDGERARREWVELINAAPLFGCDVVSGFTGRLPGLSIPENIERFKAVWTPLAELAAAKKVRIAWENCSMGGNWQTGNWNIAHNPDAWELMFTALPADNVGLEWEPCHQMIQLIDPLPQIRDWSKRIFHVHGKDATIRRDLLARHGFAGAEPFCRHRTPGFGDSNWTDIISELRRFGFTGSIDIEGWHDPVYREALEMTGQVHALHYLRHCRGDV